jgi:TPR repeat protein
MFALIEAAAIWGVINFYFNFENTAKRSCESGDIESCYELGHSYHKGSNDVKQNFAKAIFYLGKACEKTM